MQSESPILLDERHYLSHMFEPQSVAIIGATERAGALGAVLVHNMLESGFRGALFAVNPKYRRVQGLHCYRRIGDVPGRVDLAVIATPAHTVPDIVAECGRAGVRAAIVLSAGFGESGAAGAQLEQKVLKAARLHGLRLLGPNSLGLARPQSGLNATFALVPPLSGSIGFISQSGALCAAILDYARPAEVGFSNVVSLGVASDLDFGEILDYMVWDYRSESLLLYVENIRDARRFLSGLRAAARAKPVMVFKVGRHPVGLRAALTHTGGVAGEDAVFDAALRRAGVIRLNNLSQLYAATKALFLHFRPRGNRLAIITNGGGPGVMAADRAGDLGIPLAQLSPDTLARLNKVLPPHWSLSNPIDLIGDSDPARYATALEALLQDDGVDGVLCLLTPQAMTRPTEVAERVIALRSKSDKPILTCWLGDEHTREARNLFQSAGIPSLRTPETAVELFSHITNYYLNQQLLTQAPAPLEDAREPAVGNARAIIERALGDRRTTLLRSEALAVLEAFHVPVVEARVAHSENDATSIADDLGYPIALRPDATVPDGTGAASLVRSELPNELAVRLAWRAIQASLAHKAPGTAMHSLSVERVLDTRSSHELAIRVWRDPVFGPVIGFGERSLSPHHWPDRAVALPPLNAFLARDLIRQTHAERALSGLDLLPAADIERIEQILLRVSEIVCELPWVRSLDIVPLYADERSAIVGDVQIEVGHVSEGVGRYAHMAIHPYPSTLEQEWTLRDGTPVLIRPLKPEDAELEQTFVRALSAETKYFRFMSALRELPPSLLAKLTQIDYDRELALIAIIENNGEPLEIGVCRYSTNPDGESCEFAIVVADAFQHSGVGRKLMETLILCARERGLKTMKGVFLSDNERMLRFVRNIGFVIVPDPETPTLRHGTLDLRA
ncbi:MAG: GNAT family N-acetyltransferase [Rhodocyclaceae bacterium]